MQNKSQEAYFGKELGSLGTIVEKHVSNIREIYEKIDANDYRTVEKNAKMYKTELSNEMKSFEDELGKAVNIERCYIGLIWETNAFAFPCCWDKKLTSGFDIKTNKVYWDSKYEVSLYDVVETKNGYKFKNPKDKVFIIAIGLGLYREGLSDGEITAIILHEIGHSFQHILIQIGTNVTYHFRKHLLQSLDFCIKPLSATLNKITGNNERIVASLGISLLLSIFSAKDISELDKARKKYGDDEVGKYLLAKYVGTDEGKQSVDRDLIGGYIRDSVKGQVGNIAVSKRYDANIINKILGVVFVIGKQIFNLVNLILTFAHTPLANLMTGAFIVGRNKEFLNKNKRAEEFADTFASYYGYGPELSRGLSKISDRNGNIDFGLFNMVYLIPGLNMWITWMAQLEARNNTLLNGYPMTRDRIAGSYKVLQFELENNKELSASQKASIQKEMEEIAKTYDKYVTKGGLMHIVYKFYSHICRNTIKNSKTTVEENVLIPLQQMKKESSLKLKPDEKKFVDEITMNPLKFLSKIDFSGFSKLGLTNKGIENIDIINSLGIDVYVNGKEINSFESKDLYGNFKLLNYEDFNEYGGKVYFKRIK